ncbi:hypothetical protein OG946_24875 [Streptomyces sp. NBC_01808]|uniref:hypothetical protein n=1 Tax=Streptomyces sp. NBC_01808 TaxID=2975947 RepID=UPI002DD81AF5|nr:hypothetical protein [Streptomyces sp. NBC_01808]WSA42728.1 hypothetical protein OG946_24875 [Streptomyces sp. NBC_01808]
MLDAAIGGGLAVRAGPASEEGRLQALAVDGETVRGSRTATSAAIALLAAMAHRGGALARRQVADKSNEIPASHPCWTAST